MSDKKLARVTLEYEDGSAIYVKGEGAQAWQEHVAGIEGLAYVHGHRADSLPWKKARVVEATSLHVYQKDKTLFYVALFECDGNVSQPVRVVIGGD